MPDAITCPGCGSTTPGEPVKFTLWGGALGPRLLHHVKCPACGVKYNGKSGRSNAKSIALYILIPAFVFLIIAYIALKH